MADVSGVSDQNRALAQSRERYEAEKQELEEKYRESLSRLRNDEARKVQQEENAGEAAVNHIQEQVKHRTEVANIDAAKREKVLDGQIAEKKDVLKRREDSQDTYVDQAKKRKDSWVKAQLDEVKKERGDVVERSNQQINEVRDWHNKRIAKAQKEVQGEEEKIRDKARVKMVDLKGEYQKKESDLNTEETQHYRKVKDEHQKQLVSEDKSFHEMYQKEKSTQAKNLDSLQIDREKRLHEVKAKNESDLRKEQTVHQKQILQTREAEKKEITQDRDRFEKNEEQIKEKHAGEVQRLEDQEQSQIATQQKRYDHDIKLQKEGYVQEKQHIRKEHEVKREALLTSEKAELEKARETHHDVIKAQEASFEKQFDANHDMARETYANQTVDLGRELLNQKQRFVKASDKYGHRESDPFYTIRDNKTKFFETSGAYVFKAHVPQDELENVHVRVKPDRVIFSGHRSFKDEIVDGQKALRTSNAQTFNEQYDIPKRVKETEVLKSYDSGVLTVIIPKVDTKV